MNVNRLLVAEFLGSLLLCLAACLGHGGFAVGAIYVALYYALGGHFNPVITLAAYLGGQTTLPESGRRLAAQGLGALAASLIGLIWYRSVPGSMWGSSQVGQVLAGELLGCFLLGVVFLRGAQVFPETGRSLTGAMVGLTMAAGATVFNGSLLNPASVVTGVLLGAFPWWFLVTGLLGSVAGIFGAAYFVHWWNQPEPVTPTTPPVSKPETPAADPVPESNSPAVSPALAALPSPTKETLPSKKR